MTELMRDVELVMTSTGSDDAPTVTRVRDSLAHAELPESYAEGIPRTTAFRRAADTLRNKNTLVRVFGGKNNLLAQVDRQANEGEQLADTRIGVYKLMDDTIGRVGYADCDFYNRLLAAFVESQVTYKWADVTMIVRDILTNVGLGVYSPKANGGVYFAPIHPLQANLLDKLERFCQRLNFRFLRYGVPDTTGQRSEIMEAVASSLEQDVKAHEDAVAEYSAECCDQTFTKRRIGMDCTRHLISRLEHLVNGHAQEFYGRLDMLAARIVQLQSDSETARRTPSGRKLVFA